MKEQTTERARKVINNAMDIHSGSAICLGENNEHIIKAFKDKTDTIVQASNMKEAVKQSYALADKEDVVLLSPACASFDLFANYEDRGFQFKKEVRNL